MKTPLKYIPVRNIGLVILIVVSIISLVSCSSSNDSTKSSLINSDDGKTTFSFTTYENGLPINWKVYFDNGEISAMFRNRIRVPKDQINRYEDMVYEEMNEVYNKKSESDYYYNDTNDKTVDIHIDLKSLDDHLAKMTEELSKKKIHIEFDEEEFNKNMKKLEKELEKLKDMDIEINFDPETLKENMKELEKNLKHLRINENDFPFNQKEFQKSMREMAENMRMEQYTMNKDFMKNMDYFHNNMKNFKENMKNLKENTKNLKSRLKCMESFIKDMKEELVKDGMIKNANDDVEINFSPEGLEINDVKVPEHLFEKYKSMYKKHFGVEIEDDWHFNSD